MSGEKPLWETLRKEVEVPSSTTKEELSLGKSPGPLNTQESQEEQKTPRQENTAISKSKNLPSENEDKNSSQDQNSPQSPSPPATSNNIQINSPNSPNSPNSSLPKQNTLEVRLDPSQHLAPNDQSPNPKTPASNSEPEESEEEQEREEIEEENKEELEGSEGSKEGTCEMFDKDEDEDGVNRGHNVRWEQSDKRGDYGGQEGEDEGEGEDGQEGDGEEEDESREEDLGIGGDQQSDQSFGREHIENRMEVNKQDQDIQDFRKALAMKNESFKRTVTQKYEKIRMEFLQHLEYRIKENERENASSVDFLEQQLEEAVNEKDAAIFRASQSRIILANTMREKYNTHFLKRACFQSWKYFYEWKKYKEAKSKFCDNYYKNRSLRKIFNGWRRVTHDEFIERAFQIRDEYEAQKRKVVYDVDTKLENLNVYLLQLKDKIEEETGLILEIPEDYHYSTGLERIKNETDELRETQTWDEMRATQTQEIFKS